MPLQTGTWTIDANGFSGSLNISVDSTGQLHGSTVFGDQVTGFWNESQQTITFIRVQTPPTTFQLYTGYLFSTPTPTGADYTLAGNFETYPPKQNVTASANTYQWVAYVDVKTKTEGKESKEGKEGKDHKDKEKEKEKEHKEELKEGAKELETVSPGRPQESTLDEPQSSGQAFIRSTERPPVGEQALH